MDLNPGTARYSTDELAPVTPISRSEREEAALLPDSSLTGLEKSVRTTKRSWTWGRLKRASTPLLASLAVFSALLALAGWVLYRVLHLSTSTHATLEVDRIDGLVSWT
jgi:hypothetical protein